MISVVGSRRSSCASDSLNAAARTLCSPGAIHEVQGREHGGAAQITGHLHQLVVGNMYQLPNKDMELPDRLLGADALSKVGLRSGHTQVLMHSDLVEMTNFTTRCTLVEHSRSVSLGLCNTPATLTRLVYNDRRGHTDDCASVYVADVLVYPLTATARREHLWMVLVWLPEHRRVCKNVLFLAAVDVVAHRRQHARQHHGQRTREPGGEEERAGYLTWRERERRRKSRGG